MISKMPTVSAIRGMTIVPTEDKVCRVSYNGALIGWVYQGEYAHRPRFAAILTNPVDTFLGYHWSFDSAFICVANVGRYYAPPF